MSSLLNSLASEAVPKEDPDAAYAGYGGNDGGGATAPSAPPPPFPSADERPVLAAPAYHDAAFAYAFLLHAMLIVFMAFAWGIRAVNVDATMPADDGSREVMDFNASTMTKFVAIACVVGGVSAVTFLALLKRCAGNLVRFALYASVAVQLVATCAMFAVSALFGFFMCIPLALTCFWVYVAQRRIPFAAAHVELAVESTSAFPLLFPFAVCMMLLSFVWLQLWSLAAFGLENVANNGGTAGAPSSRGGSMTGGVLVFGMIVSLVWGSQLISYVTEFVVCATVGAWWFSASPGAPVVPSLRRAVTNSLGSLSLAALVVAVLEALRLAARQAQRAQARRQNGVLAFVACVGTCILTCVERLIETLNAWAVVMMALKGDDFRSAGGEVMDLFRTRGFGLVVNEDLVLPALRIACLVPACIAAITGGALSYVGTTQLAPADRGTLAGIAAFLSFLMGFALCSVLSGVIASGVKTIFVAFALNPGALGVTHPEALGKLVAAWNAAYPEEFRASGHDAYFGSGGNRAYAVPDV